MINNIVLEKLTAGLKSPDTGKTVQAYNYDASDVAGSAPNGSLIGAYTEVSTTGVYTIDSTDDKKVTIVSGGLCVAGLIGILLNGEAILGAF